MFQGKGGVIHEQRKNKGRKEEQCKDKGSSDFISYEVCSDSQRPYSFCNVWRCAKEKNASVIFNSSCKNRSNRDHLSGLNGLDRLNKFINKKERINEQ